jgi:hypothetical protein
MGLITGVTTVEVGVELGEQSGHGDGEHPAVVLRRDRRGLLGVDDRSRAVQPVAAFDAP